MEKKVKSLTQSPRGMLPGPEPPAVTLTPRPGGPSGSNSVSWDLALDSAGHAAPPGHPPPPGTDSVLLLTQWLTRQGTPAVRLSEPGPANGRAHVGSGELL